jgi:hypothetical protein
MCMYVFITFSYTRIARNTDIMMLYEADLKQHQSISSDPYWLEY